MFARLASAGVAGPPVTATAAASESGPVRAAGPPWPELCAALFAAVTLLMAALIVVTNLLVAASVARTSRTACWAWRCRTALLVPPPAPAGPLRLLPAAAVAALAVCSVLTTAAIAGDRCASLAWPLRYSGLVTRRAVARYVAAVWLCGLLVGAGVTCLGPGPAAGCRMDAAERSLAAVAAGAVFIPACCVLGRQLPVPARRPAAAAAHCCCSVVAVFVVCWGPLAGGAVLRARWLGCGGPPRDWLLLLAACSAAANPFLYSLNSSELQLGLRKLFSGTARPTGEWARECVLCAVAANQPFLVAPLHAATAALTVSREAVSTGGTVTVNAPATVV
ncbi:hypothetical protein FJT64_000032 [Amphibalanus amphitrite]|uniref:G-protein coupled receptors family 1 profile domain-containing protein n=1 Tax=Amphibalanus amphitrite TaxID=1232801 RepID=A0A6A4XHZ7_AMPAM|nr:hypothetical protein FJT64_000032 [Amphibalanus amphitrite]